MVKLLTPKVFYKVLFSFMTLFVLVMLILMLPDAVNLSSSTVAVTDVPKEEVMTEFIPCPGAFKSGTCSGGSGVQILFTPLFRVFEVKPHFFLRSSLSWGFQPTCWYQGERGQLYRLQGKITQGGPCIAVENGFRCER